MKAHFADQEIGYTGAQLRSLWIYRTFGIVGDAIVCFLGPAELSGESLVDQVDAAAGDSIRAARMLHLLVEHFDGDLAQAVLRQRLLVCLAAELLSERRLDVRREGDDLHVGDRKLSVSIATVSPVSTLIHLGINVDPEGAPVPACGLQELGCDPKEFGLLLAMAYVSETESMGRARCTVRSVP